MDFTVIKRQKMSILAIALILFTQKLYAKTTINPYLLKGQKVDSRCFNLDPSQFEIKIDQEDNNRIDFRYKGKEYDDNHPLFCHNLSAYVESPSHANSIKQYLDLVLLVAQSRQRRVHVHSYFIDKLSKNTNAPLNTVYFSQLLLTEGQEFYHSEEEKIVYYTGLFYPVSLVQVGDLTLGSQIIGFDLPDELYQAEESFMKRFFGTVKDRSIYILSMVKLSFFKNTYVDEDQKNHMYDEKVLQMQKELKNWTLMNEANKDIKVDDLVYVDLTSFFTIKVDQKPLATVQYYQADGFLCKENKDCEKKIKTKNNQIFYENGEEVNKKYYLDLTKSLGSSSKKIYKEIYSSFFNDYGI